MNRLLIPILIILVLASGLVSCAQQQSKVELRAYLIEEVYRLERQSQILKSLIKAMEAVDYEAKKPATPKDEPSSSSKTQMETIKSPKPVPPVPLHLLTPEEIVRALTTRAHTPEPTIPKGLKDALISKIAALDWAIKETDSLILDYKKVNPPPEVRTYHGLMVEVLLKRRAQFSEVRFYFSSLLSSGRGDNEASVRARNLFLEEKRLRQLAEHEFQDLLKKLRE